MPVSVSDTSGNWNETIEHGAKTLGRSRHRRKVFKAIYTGKKNPKAVKEIARFTNLRYKVVLTEGKKLFDEGIVHQTKVDGITAYEKIRFYQKNRDRILKYAENPAKLEKLPTKRRPSAGMKVIQVNVPSKRIKAKRITIDDFPGFSKVRKVKNVPWRGNAGRQRSLLKARGHVEFSPQPKWVKMVIKSNDLFSRLPRYLSYSIRDKSLRAYENSWPTWHN